MTDQDVAQQYRTTDLLRIRAETHRLHTENPFDLDDECAAVLGLGEGDSHLDVGCGPGVFLRYLRAHGHLGRLAGLDQSGAMIAEAVEAADAVAVAEAPAIEWYVGEADALPFPDAAFTSVSARHMLYHVPDIPAALREFGRVLVPEGSVLVTANGADTLRDITALEYDVLAEFGVESPPPPSTVFNTANAPDLLGAAFAGVRETVLRSALVFEDAAPVVRYVTTQMGFQRTVDDPALSAAVHDRLTARVEQMLREKGGVWRDAKQVGVYLCKRPISSASSTGK